MPFGLRIFLVLAAAAALPACSSCRRSADSQGDIALLPQETGVLFTANLEKARTTAFWRKLMELRGGEKRAAATQPPAGDGAPKDYEEFVARCGLDPLKQLTSIAIALPSAGPATAMSGQFGAIFHGTFDPQKLVACARATVKQDGGELKEEDYAGKKVYTDTLSSAMSFTLLDSHTTVVAGREWIKKMVDLATGKAGAGARANAPLVELLKKVDGAAAFSGIGLVSDAMRARLKEDPRLAVAASMKDAYGSLDFTTGAMLSAVVDLGSDAAAKELSDKVSQQVQEWKKSSRIMMMGLASYIDAIQVVSHGSAFQLNVKLTQQQLDELIMRAQGLLGGGMIPPMGRAVAP